MFNGRFSKIVTVGSNELYYDAIYNFEEEDEAEVKKICNEFLHDYTNAEGDYTGIDCVRMEQLGYDLNWELMNYEGPATKQEIKEINKQLIEETIQPDNVEYEFDYEEN